MAVEVREFKGTYGVFKDGELLTRTTSIDVATSYAATLEGSKKPRVVVVEPTEEPPQDAPPMAETAVAPAKKPATAKRGARKKKTAGF